MAIYLAAMVATVVVVDVAFLRGHFWARLIVNVAIVASFLVGYVVIFRWW